MKKLIILACILMGACSEPPQECHKVVDVGICVEGSWANCSVCAVHLENGVAVKVCGPVISDMIACHEPGTWMNHRGWWYIR